MKVFGFVLLPRLRRNTRKYEEARKAARALVVGRLAEYVREYREVHGVVLTRGAISIRKQKTRWGSCSSSGNLSFNYRIVFLPSHLADSIIVHELCHTKELNHSKRFWELVAMAIPDYAARKKELARYRF